MAIQPFIYKEAAPGQQAVQYAQMKANADLERNRMVDAMYQNILRNATQQGANMGQMALTRSQMDRDAARDAQRKSEFDQSMALEKDRLAATNKYQQDRAEAIQKEKDLEYDRQYEAFLRLAENQNALGYVPGPNNKLPNGLIYDPVLKKVVPLMQPRAGYATAPTAASHMERIEDLRNRTRSLVDAGPTAVPRSSEWVGPEQPKYNIRSSDLVGPEMPKYNVRSSEMVGPEMPMFEPSDYDEAITGRKRVQPGEYYPSDEPPVRLKVERMPFGFSPRSTDFNVPSLYDYEGRDVVTQRDIMGLPPASPFEQEKLMVIPQSELLRLSDPQSYEDATTPMRPYVSPGVYLPSDFAPRRRIPGAFLPY